MLRLRLTLLLCLFAALFAGAASAAPRPAPARSGFGARVTRYARHFLGVPYAYGGASPSSGFDCSGFVAFVYGQFGISLPHYTFGQFDVGRAVGRGALEPGDLVFFDGVNHV